ncbi:MAG: TolC family protein, partial [Phycisphaeraceae bacterium]|nr:TolC family protein [Phycisphaeraceae bacterium]
HPAVERARRGVEAAREQHGLARLARWPDLTASVHYNAVKDDGLASSATGEDAWWMGLAINLPLDQGKYDAKERAARAGLAEAVAMLTAERNRVAREVREARDRVAVHMEHVTALRAEIVPDSRRATEAAMAAYRGGAGSYLDVIDAWRRSLQFQLMLDDHTAMLGSARADLEQALGRPVVSAARSAPEDSDDE